MILSLMYILALAIHLGPPQSDEIRVAVASNFTPVMKDIVKRFHAESPNRVIVISGSTGKHYAQIRNGARVDIFFAADMRRPTMLESEGIAAASSRFTYAIGKIILWSPIADYVDSEGQVLNQGKFRHLAIANPRHAPYGQAAREVLQAKGLWDALTPRLVQGENIDQAFHFVYSGNAELGFVALSQVMRSGRSRNGSWWEIPQSLYTPITQQAVIINDRPSVRMFVAFMKSGTARKIMHKHGYETP